MKCKKFLRKSFLLAIAAIPVLFTGCYTPDYWEPLPNVITLPHMQEQAKKAGTDVDGNPLEINVHGKSVISFRSDKRNILAELVIPEGIERIKTYQTRGERPGVFIECYRLKKVTLPSTLLEICQGSFFNCTRLSSITIPDSVVVIEKQAFWNCRSLSLTIPANVKLVGDGAFFMVPDLRISPYNTALKSRGDGSVVRTYDKSLIYVKQGKGEYVVEDVKQIAPYTFVQTEYDKVVVAEGVEEIGEFAFLESSITAITLPGTLLTINYAAFQYCTELTEITIPSSVYAIGDYAFAYCENLRKITLNEGLSIIGQNVVQNKDIVLEIPASVKEFHPATYYVKEITVKPGSKYYKMGKSGEIIHIPSKKLVYVPRNISGKYVVPEEVEEIAHNALGYCNEITEIYAHSGLKKIDYQMLDANVKLQIVDIGPNTEVRDSKLGKNSKIIRRAE